MSLKVITFPTITPRPILVRPLRVRQEAIASGNPNGQRTDALAVTIPILTIDQTDLHYEQRRGAEETEFRFDYGMLRFTLSHTIYLADTLTPCEQNIWY